MSKWDTWREEATITPGTPQCDYCHKSMTWIAESYDPIRTLFICDKAECVTKAEAAMARAIEPVEGSET